MGIEKISTLLTNHTQYLDKFYSYGIKRSLRSTHLFLNVFIKLEGKGNKFSKCEITASESAQMLVSYANHGLLAYDTNESSYVIAEIIPMTERRFITWGEWLDTPESKRLVTIRVINSKWYFIFALLKGKYAKKKCISDTFANLMLEHGIDKIGYRTKDELTFLSQMFGSREDIKFFEIK